MESPKPTLLNRLCAHEANFFGNFNVNQLNYYGSSFDSGNLYKLFAIHLDGFCLIRMMPQVFQCIIKGLFNLLILWYTSKCRLTKKALPPYSLFCLWLFIFSSVRALYGRVLLQGQSDNLLVDRCPFIKPDAKNCNHWHMIADTQQRIMQDSIIRIAHCISSKLSPVPKTQWGQQRLGVVGVSLLFLAVLGGQGRWSQMVRRSTIAPENAVRPTGYTLFLWAVVAQYGVG